MNNTSFMVVLISLLGLFVTAEAASFIFKVHSQRFYVVFHLAGGALVYLLFWNLIQNPFLSLFLVFVVGVLWEIHEWLLWKFFLKKKIYKPGGKDTLNDLLMDVLGAFLVYVVQIF